jgi:hypothetical protein
MPVFQIVATVCSMVAALSSIAGSIIVLRMKLESAETKRFVETEVGNLKVYFEKARADDKRELMQWAESHFVMRHAGR